MKLPAFDHHAPTTVAGAVELLATHDAVLLAGGQSLLPRMAQRAVRPPHVVDLAWIAGLDRIETRPDGVAIGAMVRQARLTHGLATVPALLADAAGMVGNTATRARGTLGGSLANADPAAELPVACAALGARVELIGVEGRRTVDVEALASGPSRTVLGPTEVIDSVVVPSARWDGWAVHEVTRRAGDYPVVVVAGAVRRTTSGGIAEVSLMAGGVGGGPTRLRAAEEVVRRGEWAVGDRTALRGVVENCIDPPADVHGSADYRRHVARTLAERVLDTALDPGRWRDGS